jgi:hypothetical protein
MFSPDDRSRAELKTACTLIAGLGDADALDEKDVQALLASAVRLYADHVAKSDTPVAAFGPDARVTATDAMVTTTAILKAVNLQLFELGMWQAWSGR